ncbi:antibiotic biosynthesis monooxygenase family protein [Fictibacillus barbaricus]|uniref:Heme-degrading monooxygenase HmoA n=1 Tax=Fictibacillus barbaricus TaxID=182136 RepID=A0ABU1TW25_9BACL|nr:antibiotic biosynthesis monooxygenase [Fictibacillus barbaricus]MDR7071416.1 heme-degrading monooxygenase HmoA [Fictibacillus barbaricus]
MKNYYAVIFTSQRTVSDSQGYYLMSEKMAELAKKQPGFIDIVSSRDSNGFGITISYWESLEAIQKWKENMQHQTAQHKGKETWYSSYHVRICKVEREYSF